MEDAAMSEERRRPESRIPVVNRILAGHMREGPEYAIFRSSGTTDWLLVLTLSGSGTIAARSGVLRTGVGDAVILRPRSLHDYGTAPGQAHWETAFAHFHPRNEWLPLLDWPQPVPGIGRIHVGGAVYESVVAALLRAARVRAGALPSAELFAVNAVEEALLWCDTQNPITTHMDERLLAILDYIDAHLADPLAVAHLAARAHLSSSRLTHLFTEHVGASPQRYVERQRIARAKQLLDLTTRPVAAIAREIGWQDALYFSRRFRHFTGQSPTAYRQRT